MEWSGALHKQALQLLGLTGVGVLAFNALPIHFSFKILNQTMNGDMVCTEPWSSVIISNLISMHHRVHVHILCIVGRGLLCFFLSTHTEEGVLPDTVWCSLYCRWPLFYSCDGISFI